MASTEATRISTSSSISPADSSLFDAATLEREFRQLFGVDIDVISSRALLPRGKDETARDDTRKHL